MANTFGKTQMAALFDEVADTTAINMTLSKDLNMYNMDDLANRGLTTNAADNPSATPGTGDDAAQGLGGSDVEWIPQEYRFEVQDGIVSSASDFQDLTDRYIPVRRNKSKRILARINTKDLRDPQRRKLKAMGMARDIANAIDIECYNTMINQASLITTSTTAFAYTDAIAAENNMLNNGLGGYNKKLFLSNTHYQNVAEQLGANQYYGREGDLSLTADALTRAYIPNLATFNTMRSDYIRTLDANTNTGVTINGNQEHTVATNDGNGFYLDNRSMTLAVNNASGTIPVGSKFTIAGVNQYNPETRTDNGQLQTFTVITAGTTSIVIQPAIVASGPYQNCSAQAANTAAVTFLNVDNDNPSLYYTPESTVLVPGNLPVPPDAGSVDYVEATTENGLPMRMTYRYDFHNEIFECKALVYFDVQVIYPWMLGMILANQTP